MTKDEIIRMAREAGLQQRHCTPTEWWCWEGSIERFAALVAAAERKRLLDAAECCRMCEHGGICYEKAKGNEVD